MVKIRNEERRQKRLHIIIYKALNVYFLGQFTFNNGSLLLLLLLLLFIIKHLFGIHIIYMVLPPKT